MIVCYLKQLYWFISHNNIIPLILCPLIKLPSTFQCHTNRTKSTFISYWYHGYNPPMFSAFTKRWSYYGHTIYKSHDWVVDKDKRTVVWIPSKIYQFLHFLSFICKKKNKLKENNAAGINNKPGGVLNSGQLKKKQLGFFVQPFLLLFSVLNVILKISYLPHDIILTALYRQ